MYKGSDVIGKVIVTYDTGERIARVRDLLFDQESDQLLGFLVDEGGWLSGAQVIKLQDVQAIGPNAVVVPSKSAIVKAKKVPGIKQILKRNNVLKGTRIMTTNGRDLGTMVDLYFDQDTGAVEGYEASGGLFADVYSGRSFVPAPRTLNIGEDVALVPPETADLMEEQVGGIKGAAMTAGDQLQTTTELTNQRLQDAAQAVGTSLQAGTQITSTKLQEVMRNTMASSMNSITNPVEQKLFVIGKTVDQTVIAANGTPLILEGQRVTPLIAEEAERSGVLDQLYRATGGRFAADLSRKLQAATESANQKLQETTQAAGENLQARTEVTNQRIQEVTRSITASLMDSIVDPTEQKLFIIGKTVDRDVIAPDGTALVAQGQQVTLLMAEDAEQHGSLHQLYQAVGGNFAAELNRRLHETADLSRQSAQATVDSSGQRLQGLSRDGATNLTNTMVDPAEQKAFVIGKSSNQDVIASSGNLVVAQGELITPLIAEEAEDLGVLDQLYRSTGGSLTAGLSRAVGGLLGGPMLNQALGRRIQRVVRTPEGVIIGAPGQIVTESVVERTRTYHKEQDLMDAVGLSLTQAAHTSTSSALSEAGVQLRRGTSQAREQADTFFERVREEVEVFQDYVAQVIEERRIKRALGRPVTRVILDQQDDVILNVGEMITHRAITLARGAGALDILLSSVYVTQPQLSNAELRAPEPGEARLKGSGQPAASL